MKISDLLVNPSLQQFEQEFESLAGKVSAQPSVAARELCHEIESRKDQIRQLQGRFAQDVSGTVIPKDLYEDMRKLKLDLRFMNRRWLKMVSNAERVKKMHARRMHVSTAAA